MAKRKRKVRYGTIKDFNPEHYALGELETIAKGRTCEAYSYSLRREDVPKGMREKAKAELKRGARKKNRR